MTHDIFRVLLIEDSEIDAKRVIALLRYSMHAQFEVVHADTLCGGIIKLEQMTIHIALVDLGLPDTDGIEVVSVLSRKFPELPIIVLTGQDDFASSVASIRAGAQDYIIKSEYSSQGLERSILHACERKSAQLRMQKFYRESMRAVVTEEIIDAAELATEHKQLLTAVESAQPQLKTLAPAVHDQLQAVMDTSTRVRTPSVTGLQPVRLTLPLVQDISRITEEHSSVADVSEDPRSVLADILDKYPGSYGPSR